jgi:hypothetical protein
MIAPLAKPIKGMHVFTRRKMNRQRLDDAYEIVNQRDGNKSRVTGCTLLASSPDSRQRREHNHLRGRNVRPDWKYQPERIHLCSAFEHGFITSGALQVEGDDATKRLIFTWDRTRIPIGAEPFQIRSKRRSQRGDL